MSRRKSINSNRETIPPALLQAQADAARAGLPSTSSCAWMLAGRGSAKCVFWESWRWASAPSHEVGIRGALSRLVDYNISSIGHNAAGSKRWSQKKNISNEMGALSKRLRVCLDSQAQAIAPKPVDLETASVAVMARCGSELQQMREFLYTGIAGFSPDPDYWSKEIEPIYLKEARKAVAVARTRDTPTAPPKPKTPPRDDRNKI